MTIAQTKHLLEKLHLFRRSYRNIGILLTKILKDVDAKILIIPPKLMEEYIARGRRRYGNYARKGQLQNELERELDGVLTSLREDFPYITNEDISLFCYSAAGFPDYLVSRLSNISSARRVSARRHQLIDLIKNTRSERREIYIAMLSTKQKSSKGVSGRNVC